MSINPFLKKHMKLTDIKIKHRLIFTFTLISLIVVGTSSYVLIQFDHISETNSSLFNKNMKAVDYLLEADRDAYQSRLAIAHSIKSKSISYSKEQFEDIYDNLGQIGQRYGKYAEIYQVKEQAQFRTHDSIFTSNYGELQKNTDTLVSYLKVGDFTRADNKYNTLYSGHFDQMREAINSSTEILLANASAEHDEVVSIAKQVFIVLLVSSSIFLAIVLISAFLVIGSITAPLRDLVIYSSKLAKGNLNIDIEVNGKDEISAVMRTYKDMIVKLKEVIGTIRTNAFELKNANSVISSTAESTAIGASEQAAAVEEIASSIEEMVSSINQNSDNSKVTNKIANQAAGAIKTGQATLTNLVRDMKEVEEKASVINEIAEKTDLLAINAAVEAARAGESGKGFAVVASEVRNLAVTSQKAATVIGELIKSNTQNIVTFNTQIEKIVVDVQKTAELVQEIAMSSNEQSTGANQINAAIQQFNSTTQENSANSESLSTSSAQLQGQAESLTESVNFFVLNEKDVKNKIDDMESQIKNLMNTLSDMKEQESHEEDQLEHRYSNDSKSNKPKARTSKNSEKTGAKIKLDDEMDEFDKY